MISVIRYSCCDRIHLFYRQEEMRALAYGPQPFMLDMQLSDELCFGCDLARDLGRKPGQVEDDPITDDCLAGRHNFKMDADRLRGTDKYPGREIFGTGGWDFCFRCTRKPCRASKYTTYGFTLLYLSDASGKKIYEAGA